jgi:hypothetical protein
VSGGGSVSGGVEKSEQEHFFHAGASVMLWAYDEIDLRINVG